MSELNVILGTARSDGETRRAIGIAFPTHPIHLTDLNEYSINGYTYDRTNIGDDFLDVIAGMLAADAVIFVTPVYWYTMSASLKVFFDRLTDLLEVAKDKGHAMRGKSVWLLATGTEDILPEGFEVPFRRTADYFAMHYRGAGYLYTGDNGQMRLDSQRAVAAFGNSILETLK